LHVLVEKPLSVHKADCDRLIAAYHARPKQEQVFGAMFNQRTDPHYAKVRELIVNGELGEIRRVNWIVTDWFRTEAYYASGGWRATWKGEGGGVLLNQCLHNLDVVAWLLGMPARVRGFAKLGRFHHIEVEDDVTAYLEFPGGATGTFVTSTGETPGTNRFELVGTRGKVVLEQNRLTFLRNEQDMVEWSRTSKVGFSKPDTWTCELPIEVHPSPHAALMTNFVNAILDHEPLIAPGEDGLHSVELANVILYSSLLDRTVELPMDGADFEKKLQQLIDGSNFVKRVQEVSSEDFTKSFNR
jgi:predicted dehydrogenase